MNRIIFYLIIVCLSLQMQAQTIWEEKIYNPLIKTVKLQSLNADFSLPIIRLGTSDVLELSFDDLVSESKRYSYTIYHCNADWSQSDLNTYQYIEGFEYGYIENYAFSFNTIQNYVRYSQRIPSSMTSFKVSGNYIIKVYEDDNPDKVIFTRKFMVLEDMTNIRADIMQARSPEQQRYKQEIDVFIEPKSSFSFADPSRFIKVYVQQNGRRDYSLLKLRQYRAREIEYSFNDANIFDAGNEFRNFDITSLRTRLRGVSNFDFINSEQHVKLIPEQDRSKLPYTSHGDLNGHYFIRNDRGDNSDLESDYAWVHFYLPIDLRLGGSFYVWGELTDWYLNEQNRMKYSQEYNMYYLDLYLKQGFYDYMIMFLPATLNPKPRYDAYEANHSETNNTYNIYVYYRKPGDTFDSFIGYKNR